MKIVFSIASLVVGVIGLGMFFKPVLKIIRGIGGLVVSILGKDENTGMVIDGIRSWGRNVAWLNIIWVCLEFGLKFAGIELTR